MSPRRAEANQQLRETARRKILEGSLRVFGRKGFHAASMEAIAEDAGVSKGLAYAYFRGKDELLAEALGARLDHLDELGGRIRAIPDPRERLAAWVDGILDHVASDPGTFRLYLSLSLDGSLSPALQRAIHSQREKLARYLAAVRDFLADLGSPEPDLDALVLRSTLLGLCLRIARPIEPLPIEAARRRVLELFIPDPRRAR